MAPYGTLWKKPITARFFIGTLWNNPLASFGILWGTARG